MKLAAAGQALPADPAPHPTNHRQGRRRRPVRGLGLLLRHGVRPLLVLADVTACVAGGLGSGAAVRPTVALTVLLVGLTATGGLYRSRLELSILDDLPRILSRWSVAAAVLILASSAVHNRGTGLTPMAVTVLLAVVATRSACYATVLWMRRTGLVSYPTLVVGTGEAGRRIAEILCGHPEYGLSLRGFLGSGPWEGLPAPELGETREMARILETSGTRVVVLTYAQLPDSELVGLIRACHRSQCELFVLPQLYEIHQLGDDMEMLWGIPLMRLRRSACRSASWRLKRVFDVTVAGAALTLLSPVLVACAVAVRLEGGPGVIFRQQRLGMDGRPFELMKFRSLRPVDETESQTTWNISHDGRLGRVGRLLRVSSLDELPQLFNILRGDMSIVGPRPERPAFVEEFAHRYPGYLARHRVPSGLTGWAQVHGLRGDTSIDDRARFDNFYIENWSLWLDLKILLRTVTSLVRQPGS